MTTFVMRSELYPVAMRATGHGIPAGIGKLGAFIGVFLLPEPTGRSLADMAGSTGDAGALPETADRAAAR